MLDLLVKSAVRRKIVGLFAMNPEEEIYSRQAAGEIGESPHAVGLELKALAKGGLLKPEQKGHQTFYRWNAEYPFAVLIQEAVEKMREGENPEMLSIPSLKRRREIQKNLDRVVADLKKYYDPQKIILFGSAATGNVGPWSDIDLAIIKKTRLPFFKRLEQLTELLDYDCGIDFLVYTPEEFERAVRERNFFKKEIVKKGKVLYKKTAG